MYRRFETRCVSGSSGSDFPARSFFNVYVQVDLPAGGLLPPIQFVNVDPLLVQQTKLEKDLFETQREVGLTLEEVYRLEELLDRTERERFGLPPRVGK